MHCRETRTARPSHGLELGINIAFSDTKENYALELPNSVLNNTKGGVLRNPNVTVTLTRPALFRMLLARVPLPELVKAGEAKLESDPAALAAIFTNLDNFDPQFNIVTP